jgi:hypothetical protein
MKTYYLKHVRFIEGSNFYKVEYSCGIISTVETFDIGESIPTIIEK